MFFKNIFIINSWAFILHKILYQITNENLYIFLHFSKTLKLNIYLKYKELVNILL